MAISVDTLQNRNIELEGEKISITTSLVSLGFLLTGIAVILTFIVPVYR